jgi:FkbM family methyltransferase
MNALTVDGVSRIYASECANDLWVRDVVFPGKRNGYFVEAGAGDGIAGSSCFLLESQLGWKGICIEPHDVCFARLQQNRPNSIHANVCLARIDGVAEYVMAPIFGRMNPYLSGVRDVLIRYKDRGAEAAASGVTVSKPASTLANLLRRHHAPREIDYGAFDIEGSEFEALRDFPFDQYRFLALSCEADERIAPQLRALLAANEYRETTNPFNRHCPWEHYWLHRSMAGEGLQPGA